MHAVASKLSLRRRRNKKRAESSGNTSAARSPRTKKQIAFAVVKWALVSGLVLGAIGATTVAILFWRYGEDSTLPSISKLSDYQPLQVSRVYSSGGKVVGEIYKERRTFVPLDNIPKLVQNAFIAAEDANFYHHGGVDYMGMVRAALVDLRSGHKREGGSTITQQVVRTFLLTRKRTIKRKIQEIILARRLEHALTKQDILTLYLNQINLGDGRYGVEEAARYYFGKDVKDLNPGEAAMLAALPKSPQRLSPKHPQNARRAKARQIYVLRQMAKHHFITREVAQKWIDAPIRVVADPYPDLGKAPEWVDLVKKRLVARYGKDKVAKLGIRVDTTLDLKVQALATQALRKALRGVDKRQGYGHPYGKVKTDKIPLIIAKLRKKLPKTGPAQGKVYHAIVTGVFDTDRELTVDLGGYKASLLLGTPADQRFNPDKQKPSERFSRGDLVKVTLPRGPAPVGRAPLHAQKRVVFASGPEGAVVVIDPHTRHVLALVGGYDEHAGDFDRATMAKRQPGSSFKPIVYAAAIDSGDFTAATIVNDAPEVYDLWKPQDYEKGKFLGPVRLRLALAKSINTVAIRVLHDIGPDRAVQLAHWMGIKSQLPAELSLALGSGVVTPVEMTNAYATFAAGGQAADPQFITKIGDQTIPPPKTSQALRPQVAYILVNMMRSVVTEGTGTRASRLKIPVVGKTGTSNDARDAWFLGMTPDIVVGVWVGFDDNRPLGHHEQGGVSAIPAFVDIIQGLSGRLRARAFPRPPGIVQVRIDKKTGLLAAPGESDDNTLEEVFIAGTQPTETAPSAGQVDAASFVMDQYADSPDGAGEGGDGGKGTAKAGAAQAPGKQASKRPPAGGSAATHSP